ncbi:MAG: hypothetical protein ACRDT0_18975 [Pseudonocardiaceae bacterium]
MSTSSVEDTFGGPREGSEPMSGDRREMHVETPVNMPGGVDTGETASGDRAGLLIVVPVEVHGNRRGPVTGAETAGSAAAHSARGGAGRDGVPVTLPARAVGNPSKPAGDHAGDQQIAPVPASPRAAVVAEAFDLEGRLLAVAEVVPTAALPVWDPDDDRSELNPAGEDLPRFGPTGMPTLDRLVRWVTPGSDAMAHPEPHEHQDVPGHSPLPDEVPGGSALSALDVAQLFGERPENCEIRKTAPPRGQL